MKKYVVYIGLLLVGLLLGWLFFGGSSSQETSHSHIENKESGQTWTCSMHPQIMQPDPGDCPICGMDLIPAASGADGLSVDQFKLTENAIALANVQTTVVGEDSENDNTITLSGKIVENEEVNAVQVSYFSGRIERLHINSTGEKIHKGQLLATIYSPELYAAQQELITAASLKASQPALYKAVRNKLKLWKLSDKQINQIEVSGKTMENFPVYATVTGTVTKKLVEQGDYIKQGQPLLKIANLNTVWANFDVYENQIQLFKVGQEVIITTNAYSNEELKGKVDFIDPVLDTKTRTIKLRVVLSNEKNLFKPGMFVTAKIESTNVNKKEITIPSSAILWTGERSVVYLKVNPKEPVFEMREVVLGNHLGNEYNVIKGIAAGDEIVINGTFTVDAAAQLQGKKSMMNKEDNSDVEEEKYSGIDEKSLEEGAKNRIEVPKDFQEQLKKVYENYIALKDALVNEKLEEVEKTSKGLVNNLAIIDMKLLQSSVHDNWMSLEKELRSLSTSISKSNNIKEQRDLFKNLSSYLIKTIQLFGINEKVYVEFCPMVDNNKGAYWLSKEEQIRNPYFGDVMLKCGEVKQVIE